MASPTVRRPLPALIALVALLLLTGIVWWRVASRDDSEASASSDTCSSPSSESSESAAAKLPGPAGITVQVLNSTTKTGLAGRVRTELQQLGFQVTMPGNAKPAVAGPASIRFGPAGKQAATLVRYYFPGAELLSTTSKTAVVQVVVGKTYKAVATQSQVDAALRGDKVSVASPTPSSGAGTGC